MDGMICDKQFVNVRIISVETELFFFLNDHLKHKLGGWLQMILFFMFWKFGFFWR